MDKYDFGVSHISFEDSGMGRIEKTLKESIKELNQNLELEKIERKKAEKNSGRLAKAALFVSILTLITTIVIGAITIQQNRQSKEMSEKELTHTVQSVSDFAG